LFFVYFYSRQQPQQKKKEFSPIDKLLFLTTRAQNRAQESATLISSENGVLEFWCLYGAAKPMGKLSMNEQYAMRKSERKR